MRASLIAISMALATAAPAYADDNRAAAAANPPTPDTPNDTIVVMGQQQTAASKVPGVVESIKAGQILTSVNALTAAETLKYLPSIEVRERYIGDRNGIVATRTTGTVSSAESLVYADGVLISNLLGNSYNFPPRWGLVTPAEIDQVDVLYGPFSAIYPGNLMGGVINISTHMPDRLEVHANVAAARESFHLYGVNQHNPAVDSSVAVGDRIGNVSFWLTYDHLFAEGHPMSFATANTANAKPVKAGETAVTGTYQDLDQDGYARLVFGAYSIDNTNQDQVKLKLGYDITPSVELRYAVALWGDHSITSAQSFLTNAATGQAIYNGTYAINGQSYTVSGLSPGITNELHLINEVWLQSTGSAPLKWKLVFSDYDYLKSHTLSASSSYDPVNNLTGSDQDQHNTGWTTADAQAIWHPEALSDHELSFGYHFDAFRLRQQTYALTQWNTYDNGAETGASYGKTTTSALYLQDRWTVLPQWVLTLGGRQEWWRAGDGENESQSATAGAQTARYPTEQRSYFSPKAALSFAPTSDFTSRFSFGRAVRFPTVSELYQQVTQGTTLLTNNPNLLPEDAWSYDWSNMLKLGRTNWRVSLFREVRQNALYSQTNTSVSPNVTEVQNVPDVHFRGIEGAFDVHDIGPTGLDFSSSVTYTDSDIVAAPYPQPLPSPETGSVSVAGNQFPRIPHWRAKVVLVYRQNEVLSYSLGWRHSSGAFSTLTNADVNHGVYGGISSYDVFDAKVTCRLRNRFSVSAGVDNLSDDKYYVSPHPYPQITGFVAVKFDY